MRLQKTWSLEPDKACVYTCLFGDYEKLNEFPAELDSKIRRICFTDDAELASDTWEIRVIKPTFAMDSVRSQRCVKILPHVYLPPEIETSLYIDNSVVLKVKPEDFLEKHLAVADIALPKHSFRDVVFDEFLVLAREGMDDPSRIFEQLNHYELWDKSVLGEICFWTAIIARHHRRKNVMEVMECWRNHVLRYSRRDQISFNAALRAAEVNLLPIGIDNYDSEYHWWPKIKKRDNKKRMSDMSMFGAPSHAQMRMDRWELIEQKNENKKLKEEMEKNEDELQRAVGALAQCEKFIEKISQRL